MPMFRTSRRVAHSPELMFALVADVEQYPQFLPLCAGLTVRRRETREDGTELLVATMRVGYKAISETFTSRVVLDRAKMTILVEYIDGPFRHLENRWNFAPPPVAPGHDVPGDYASGDGVPGDCAPDDGVPGKNGCDVGFFITYEFASRSLGLLMGAMFDRAFRKFAEAFEARADAIYGRPAA